MTTRRFQEILLLAIIENSQPLHDQAQMYALQNNFTQKQIDIAFEKVKNFLRWHGTKHLLPKDLNAVIKVQAVVRTFLIRKRLKEQMKFWQRLAYIDSCETHLKNAERIYSILN